MRRIIVVVVFFLVIGTMPAFAQHQIGNPFLGEWSSVMLVQTYSEGGEDCVIQVVINLRFTEVPNVLNIARRPFVFCGNGRPYHLPSQTDEVPYSWDFVSKTLVAGGPTGYEFGSDEGVETLTLTPLNGNDPPIVFRRVNRK